MFHWLEALGRFTKHTPPPTNNVQDYIPIKQAFYFDRVRPNLVLGTPGISHLSSYMSI